MKKGRSVNDHGTFSIEAPPAQWNEEDRHRVLSVEKTSRVAWVLQLFVGVVVLGAVWYVYWIHHIEYEAKRESTLNFNRAGGGRSSLLAMQPKNDGANGRPPGGADGGTQQQEIVISSSPSPQPFRIYNDYTKDYPITWTRKWSYLAEPYRPTYLEAACEDCPDDTFEWLIDGTVISNTVDSDSGRLTSLEFKDIGYHTVTLRRMTGSPSAGLVEEVTGQVMVKYVRREIRSLTDEDRQRFLDALEVLYRVQEEDGKILYGERYTPMSYFISMHLDGAGTTECDGWHDDAGVVTNHVGVTLAVEQALQVVDPRVTIPYWDHTIDAELSTDGTLKDSVIFDADWFSENDPDNGDDNELQHVVAKGRWAYTPVMKDAWQHVHNPYGLLRSPWNTSPVPYLQRSTKTNGVVGFTAPTCSSFSDCYRRPSFAAMQNCLNGGTHGPVHILIGGEWGLGSSTTQFMKQIAMGGKHPLLFKSLWRRGFMREPGSCTGVAGEECRTSCPADLLEEHEMSAYDVLVSADQLNWLSESASSPVYWDDAKQAYTYRGHEDDEEQLQMLWDHILQVLCDTGTVGEMYTSAAPQDPTFWIIHPSMERFLGQKLRTAGSGWDRSWGYFHQDDPGDDGVVCDWSMVVDENDLPRCTAGSCFGHGEFDLRPFSLVIGGQSMLLTNRQILDLIQPESDELPYMYDNYEWPKCEELGIVFS